MAAVFARRSSTQRAVVEGLELWLKSGKKPSKRPQESSGDEEKSSSAIDSPGGTVQNSEHKSQSNAFGTPPVKEIQWLEKLLDVLHSGNQDAISAVTRI